LSSITLRHLTKQFGNVTAVDRMDLELLEGELIAFLGPSGCGKTTTLRMIAGFETPSEGEIFFGGDSVTQLSPDKRNIGMVFQNYALFPHMTVTQNVAFGLEMRGVTQPEIAKRVAEILAKTQLGNLGERYPRQLSGGQQQRTALARALVISPRVLLLDEPLANLDAKLREEMRFYIRHLQREFGITTIYVTHDQAEAMVLADRIAVIMNGVIQQLDRPEEIYQRPASRQVAEFIGLTNFIPGTVLGRTGEVLEVQSAAGIIRSLGRPALGQGAGALVSVRPESLHFTQSEAVNTVGGVVKEKAFLGNLIDYQVEVSAELLLRVQAAPRRRYEPGDRVRLEFAAEDAWAVPGERR
jgi:putative spermidine/putrescine transport system ATP-binding protein